MSFDQERAIYSDGTTSGNRDILKLLMYRFAGGYFYAAAANWLNSSPLAPGPPVPPAKTVQLVMESHIRAAPSLNATIMDTPSAGTLLKVVGALKTVAGSHWYPVTGLTRTLRSSENDRVRVIPTSSTRIELRLSFAATPGETDETLGGPSLDALKKVLSERGPPTSSGMTIVGYKLRAVDGSLEDERLLLRRQAMVAKTLKDLGFDVAHSAVSVSETKDPALDNSVTLIINGS